MRQVRHDRLLRVLLGATVTLVLWYAFAPAGRTPQVVTAWVFIAAVHAVLAMVARSTAGTPGLPSGARRFWHAVAAGALVYLVGDLAQVVVAARHPGSPSAATGGTIQLITLSAGSLWLGLALLLAPLGLPSRRERVRFWLDVATVLVAAAVVGWFLVVPGPGTLTDAALAVLMGPVVLVLCVFIVAKLTMSGTTLFTRACAFTGTLAAAVKSSADALSSHGTVTLPWFLALTVTSHALLTIAVRVTQVQINADPLALAPRVRRRPYSLLPYAAIAVTYALLTVAIWREDAGTVPIALAGAALSTLLVVLRQLDAFRENARLLTELHESLAQQDSLASRLQHQATHDGLTGLANRTLFAERLDTALATGGPAVVLLVDLDDFKLVNDAYGHAAGDGLLRVVADRMRACVRETDTVSRIGGDEFAILLAPGRDDEPLRVAQRLVRDLEVPVPVDGGSARVGASVGIAYARPGSDGESLLREADHAMYAVKRAGKGSYAVAEDPVGAPEPPAPGPVTAPTAG